MTTPTTPHRHAYAIKAWAEGMEIEVEHDHCAQWVNCPEPDWNLRRNYRVKPAPKLSPEAEILIADFVNWTRIDARNGPPSSGQWAAFNNLRAYILKLETK